MKKIALLLSILALSLSLYSFQKIQAASPSFYNVIPFVTGAGRVGFFDQNNGEIYIYDNDAKKLKFKGRLHELGKEIEQLELDNESNPTLKYGYEK